MKRVIHGLIFVSIALPAMAQAQQAPPWYEVEIILFEHLNPDAAASERWPREVVAPNLEGSIELLHEAPPEVAAKATAAPDAAASGTPGGAVPYLILPPEQYQLNDAYRELVDAPDYLPYVHVAWRQIIPPREHPDRIFIHDQLSAALQDAPGDESAPAQAAQAAPSAADIFADDMLIEGPLDFNPPAHTLSGVVSLGIGRYLHVNADLLLYKPQAQEMVQNAPPDENLEFEPPSALADTAGRDAVAEEDEPPPEFFRIQGDLRLPSGEVHYLDHPRVGMLILFTPYTPPEPQPADAQSDSDKAIEPFVDVNQSTPTRQSQ